MNFNDLYSDNGVLKVSLNQTRALDHTSQAIIKTSKTVNVTDFFLQLTQQALPADSVIIYTDYTNIQLRAACTTINNFWIGQEFLYYFVLVRNRTFDSLNEYITGVVNKLVASGFPITDMVFIYNNATCTN